MKNYKIIFMMFFTSYASLAYGMDQVENQKYYHTIKVDNQHHQIIMVEYISHYDGNINILCEKQVTLQPGSNATLFIFNNSKGSYSIILDGEEFGPYPLDEKIMLKDFTFHTKPPLVKSALKK